MLQLVVEIGNTQAMMLPVTRTLSLANPDDKLKHIGHLSTAGRARAITAVLPVQFPPKEA